MSIITRRSLLRSMLAAPAIIAIDRLMPVKPLWTPTFEAAPTAIMWLDNDVFWIDYSGTLWRYRDALDYARTSA